MPSFWAARTIVYDPENNMSAHFLCDYIFFGSSAIQPQPSDVCPTDEIFCGVFGDVKGPFQVMLLGRRTGNAFRNLGKLVGPSGSLSERVWSVFMASGGRFRSDLGACRGDFIVPFDEPRANLSNLGGSSCPLGAQSISGIRTTIFRRHKLF